MQKIVTFLWFDNNAEEAMNFYTSVFKNSKIVSVARNGDAGPGPKGSVLLGTIDLDGQQFHLLNGGPTYRFTPAISLYVNCESQEEVDYFWEKLQEGGGKPVECGWLTDRFGLSWQIVPTVLTKYLSGPDPAGTQRAFQAMLQMQKLDIAKLKAAYEG